MAYRAPDKNDWQGRIDSTSDYEAFRWHQWLQPYDLSKSEKLPLVGQFSIGFLGFACDEGIRRNKGRQGAALGPRMIRKELSNLPCLFTQDLILLDCGDIIHKGEDLEDLQMQLAYQVEAMIRHNIFPIILGGGHELAMGHYLGLKTHYPQIAIVNFDAHLDMRPYPDGPSSGTMFRQIADTAMASGDIFRYLCLGLQRRGNTVALLKSAKVYGAQYRYAREMIHEPFNATETCLHDYLQEHEAIYATLCTDVIASAYAPGVSSAQPLGLHPEMVLSLLKTIVGTGKLVAFDVAEVSPRYDQDNVTANLASTFIFGLVNALADLHGLAIDI